MEHDRKNDTNKLIITRGVDVTFEILLLLTTKNE